MLEERFKEKPLMWYPVSFTANSSVLEILKYSSVTNNSLTIASTVLLEVC